MAVSEAFGPPAFVVAGEWQDHEWLALQQEALRRALSREEYSRLIAGPRGHPFGADSYRINRDGQWLIYPNREAAGV